MGRGIAGWAVGLAVAATLAVTATEVAFRLVIFPEYRTLQQVVFTRHPVYGFYNKPNLEIRRYNPLNWDVVNHTNSLGMRGFEKDRVAELAGVWVGGDSNTYAGGVGDGDIYVHRLREHGFMAANLATEGNDMASQAIVVRDLAAKGYRPRAVILGLTMYNVLQDYAGRLDKLEGPLPSPGAPAIRRAPAVLADRALDLWTGLPRDGLAVRALLIRNSAVYGWVKVGVMGIPALRDWTRAAGLRADLDLTFKFDPAILGPLDAANPALPLADSTAGYARRFQDLVRRELGVPFGIVVFPAYHQIHPDRFRRHMAHAGLEGRDLDPLRPTAALVAALRARGVPVLDVLPALRASGIAEPTFLDDGHLNPAAHAVVAAAVAGWLERDLGVEPAP